MNWIDGLKAWLKPARAAAPENVRNETALPDIRKGTELFEWLTGGMSAAGVAVTEQSAMRVSAVYACVNLIGGAIASLPLPIYQRTTDGRERARHAYWWLLNEQPNPSISAAVFWEWMASSVLLMGDAFAEIEREKVYGRTGAGALSFTPRHKSRVKVTHAAGRLLYLVTDDDGKVRPVFQEDMLHIPGPGFDGLNGMSQIRHALRTPAGIALAADEYSAAFFKNGAKPDFAIEVDGTVSPEQQDMIRKAWSDRYGGLSNAHLPALLTNGSKVHELSINAEDAQLIETRRFQVEDVARIFGVPPHMIGHTSASTSWGTGIEQQSIGFVKYTLQRHLVKFEQELNRKLWPTRERYFVEFNTAGLERGDYKSRNEGYRIALGRAGEPGWMTVNEVRRLENMPPVEGGDQLNQGAANEPPAQAAG